LGAGLAGREGRKEPFFLLNGRELSDPACSRAGGGSVGVVFGLQPPAEWVHEDGGKPFC